MAAPALSLMPDTAPRLTLVEVRGTAYPPPGSDAKKVATYVKALLADTEQDALVRFKRATHNLLFADGRQFIDWSLKDKSWRDIPTSDGRTKQALNYIRPILRSRLQRMLSSPIVWAAIPRDNSHEEKDRARVAGDLLDARWHSTVMDGKLRGGLWLAYCTGCAFLKQFWNPTTGPLTPATLILPHPVTGQPTPYPITPDGQPLVNPENGDPLSDISQAFTYRPGDTDTALRSLFNVRMNQDASGLDPSEGFRWLTDSDVVPLSVIRDRYGSKALRVVTTDGVASYRQYERIVKSLSNRPGSVSADTSGSGTNKLPDHEVALLTEYWEPASDSLPDGRLITMAGEEVLYDEKLPQGFVPYVALFDERRPFDPYGRPSVDDLIAPQKVINSQWGYINDELRAFGYGQFIGFDMPGLFEQLTNTPHAHIRVPMKTQFMTRNISDLMQRVPPPPISGDRWRLIDAAKATMFDIGAYHEIQRGQVPPGVDSGIAVSLLQEAENGQLHDTIKTLKATLIEWGRQTLKLARWGYGDNEERWIPVQRPDLGYLVESVKGQDLPDPETILLDLDSFKPASQAAMNAEVKEAMAAEWLDPRQGMKLLDMGRGLEGGFESENRQYAKARRENLAIEKTEFILIEAPPETPHAGYPDLLQPQDGAPFLLPEDDDHLTHIEIHQEILLDDTKPWPVRQVVALHIAVHRFYLQMSLGMIADQEAEQNAPKGEQSPRSPSSRNQ